MSQVAFVKTQNRSSGVNQALDLIEIEAVRGKHLFVKPNFNSADPPPGSTHNETLGALVRRLHILGADRLTVGDRSGMGSTRDVIESKGIPDMATELGFDTINFDELESNQWKKVQEPGSHWSRGFALPLPVLNADGIIQTCCLKTHRFGGDFTLALKNSVGLAAKQIPGEGYNYMSELHGSSHQRLMIAEINAAYEPDLILLDGVNAFVEGGPDRGTLVNAQVMLAGTDPVAIDAVGVAILRHFGTTPSVSRGPIFQQEQISRAAELGLGIAGPEQIELVTGDDESAAYAAQIREVLDAG